MAKDVVIRISATDAASPTFKRIASEAKKMGADVSSSSQQASRSLDGLKSKGTEIGAALGTVTAGLAVAGRAAYNETREIDALRRVYGEAAADVLRYTEAIQENTNYSDNQARQAALNASTLTRSYGLQTEQIQQLLSRSSDLAAVYGLDLTDAANRLTAAIRGEAEAAEVLGVTLNDTYVASQAAARGMTGWTTTMTDAEKAAFRFTLLMEQTGDLQGAAAAQAEGLRGVVYDLRDSLEDNLASFGRWTGGIGEATAALGDMALLLPVLGAGLGKLASGLGAMGLSPGMLGPLALLAGGASLAYGYSQDNFGTTATNDFWNNFFLRGSQVMNAVLPGNPYNEQKYIDQIAQNGQADAIASLLIAPGEDTSVAWDRIAMLTGRITGEMSKEELIKFVVDQARYTGMSVPYYIESKAKATPGFMRDPVTGVYMPAQEYYRYSNARYFDQGGQLTSGAFTMNYGNLADSAFIDRPARYPFMSEYRGAGDGKWWTGGGGGLPEGASEYMRGGMGAVAMTGIGANDAATTEWMDTTKLENYRASLRATYGEYAGLVEGINSVNDATRAFNATQNSLLEQSSVFQAQQSEYSGVLSDMEAAYEVLQKRQAEGIALSREEQEFMKNYATNTERMTGAVEDAIVEQGLLAGQYAENVTKGDQLNEMLAGNTTATGDLVEIIRDLILTMEGVPEEVRSRIEIDRAEEARATLASIAAYLNGLDGRQVNFTVNASGNGLSVGNPSGPGIIPLEADGGTIFSGMRHYADGGTHAIVGERGPELVWLPNGSQVMNTEGSQSRMRGQRTNGGNVYVTVYANSWGEFQDSMRSRGLAEALY